MNGESKLILVRLGSIQVFIVSLNDMVKEKNALRS